MDGKYRRVQVKLANNIEAKLDYRSGYFGQKQSPNSPPPIKKTNCNRL